ncbi:Cotton fiber protein [Quillaja saponaria]|uniref:Cotton fiber protein n=1 Tax=Quillaja saponaria TaxID=32244 RepID=A0AAD7QA94_QUISA|nr:Cotton fiber protein [Quillaja saponaria]
MLMEEHHADKFINNVEVPTGPQELAMPAAEEIINIINTPNQQNKSSLKKKKKRGAMHMLKVALFMLRRRSKKSKSLPVEVASKGTWKRLLGTMRPLHLQSNRSDPSPPLNHDHDHVTIMDHHDDDVSVYTTPRSPAESPEASMSRYASAVNLQELDNGGNDDVITVEDVTYDLNDGDEMIDAKAEEFIAHFYQQMRLQRLDSADRCYQERIQRSIG